MLKVLDSEVQKTLAAMGELSLRGKLNSLEFFLPVLLRLNNQPYSITDYKPFGPLFCMKKATTTIWQTGRQLSKTTSAAAETVLLSAIIDSLRSIHITPLFEQIRRFSHQYVKPFIEHSPIRPFIMGPGSASSVLEKTFSNLSRLNFSFAFLDAERTRGMSGDRLHVDEVQDLDPDFLPVILETISASRYEGTNSYTGTPKGYDSLIYRLMQDSSKAEWFTKCEACGHWNIASLNYDLKAMIRPEWEDVSKDRPGTRCSKCYAPINCRNGRWVHYHEDRVDNCAGYHVPQCIMPLHAESAGKWRMLLGKSRGLYNYTPAKFANEVLGESYDLSQKVITESDLRKAACLNIKNNPYNIDSELVYKARTEYVERYLCIDWGGGGEEHVSFTAFAVLALTPTGKIDVLWARKFFTSETHEIEAVDAKKIFTAFDCHWVVHDYTGGGTLRQTILENSGQIPTNVIIPVTYTGPTKRPIVQLMPHTTSNTRNNWSMDKTRSLLYTISAIRGGVVRFFKYDYVSKDDPGLLNDFLALMADKREVTAGGETYLIRRDASKSDDIAQAINIGCNIIWHRHGYPNFNDMSQNFLEASTEAKEMQQAISTKISSNL